MEISPDTKRNISLSTIASVIVILPATWLLMKPLIASSLAEEIQQTVQHEVRPINGAFVVLLQSNIANIRRRISRLEYRRDQPPPDDYTEQDADDLVNLQMELASSVAALDALRQGTG